MQIVILSLTFVLLGFSFLLYVKAFVSLLIKYPILTWPIIINEKNLNSYRRANITLALDVIFLVWPATPISNILGNYLFDNYPIFVENTHPFGLFIIQIPLFAAIIALIYSLYLYRKAYKEGR